MARYLQLPGFGDRVDQTVALTSGAAAVFTDEYDMSRCAQFAVQVKTWAAGDLTIQLKQSFDGTNFSDLGAPQTTVVAGDVIQVNVTAGPFGIIKVSLASSDTTASVTITFVGFNLPWSN